MSVIVCGAVPYGTQDLPPLKGWPEGKIRIRQRKNDFVRVRVKTDQGIESYYPEIKDGFLIPKILESRNITSKIP